MSKRLTYEYVKEYIESFGYRLISSEYENAHKHLIVECDNNHRYSVNFNNFKCGKRCPKCTKSNAGDQRRLSYAFVKNNIEQGGELTLLSQTYKNNSTPLLIRCNNNHIFKITYCSLQKNMSCPKCTKERIAKQLAFTYQEVKDYVESQGYTLISKQYINAGQKIEMLCPNGHVVKMKYNNFRSGKRCRICSMKAHGDKKRYTLEQVKEFIESVEGYELISTKYKRANEKLKIQCPKGHMFECSYNKFQQGQRCPICQQSKGEEKIRQYLEQYNIFYQRQYSFDDCRNIEPLRFDFAVFDDSNNLLMLIEYDGEYHYFPIEGQKKLKYQQKLDKIKNTYCLKNNILLLRISYWDFDNIEQILIEHKITA